MKIKVFSYNIKCDDTIKELEGEYAWENRKSLLAENIADFDADIIGMQEVMPHQYQYLKNSLENKYSSIFANRDDNAKNGEGCPIFFKTEKFDLIFYKTIWLSQTPDIPASTSWDSRWPRICTYAVLADKQSKTKFAFLNTHLDHKSELARENGLKLIYQTIEELNLPCILTGDFNSSRDSNATLFISSKLKNANTQNNGDITFHLFGKPEILNEGTRYIDYIFCKGFEPSNYMVHNQKPIYNIISDHYAISSDMEI